VAETGSLVSEPSWADLTLIGSLSPPVETLALIPLEDTPTVVTPDEVPLHDEAPSESPPRSPLDETPAEAVEASEEPVQVADAPEESVAVDDTSTAAVIELALEEASVATTSEPSTETTEILPVPEEREAEPSSENEDPIPSSSEEEPKGPETHEESEVVAPLEGTLELDAPPPAEPIPPESESDITDEAGGHDGDELRASGEEEAMVT